jgi:hypothetical protein
MRLFGPHQRRISNSGFPQESCISGVDNILAGIVKMGMWHFVASSLILFAVSGGLVIVKQIA